jgi:phosphatidylinositol-3-phosphatase
VAYATNYLNVVSTPSGNNPHVHPSEPNYFWAEAGNNFLVSDDDDPYVLHGNTNQANNQDGVLHLATLLDLAGKTWRSYQEDIDLTPGAGQPTNTAGSQLNNVVPPRSQWTVPLTSFSGTFVSGVNQFNGSNQFNYAAKHNPMVLFSDTNGGNDATPAWPTTTGSLPISTTTCTARSITASWV